MRLLSFDLETGGLNAATCGITQLATVVADASEDWESMNILHRFSCYVLPEDGMVYEPEALTIQGMTLERLQAEGRPMGEVIAAAGKLVDRFFGESKRCSPIAHNAEFDTSFLKAACGRSGARYPFNFAHVCTMHTFRMMRLCGLHDSYRANLEAVAATLGIPQATAHDALADAEVCLLSAFEMMRRMRDGIPVDVAAKRTA